MKTLLSESSTDAYRNLGAALRLFWPVLVCIVLMYAVGVLLRYYAVMLDSNSAMGTFLLMGIFAPIYIFLALCQGAVGWHRRVLLNEIPDWISPVPRRRAFQYGLAAFLFLLLLLIPYMIVGFFMPSLTYAPILAVMRFFGPASFPTGQLEAAWKILWPLQLILFFVCLGIVSVMLRVTRSWLLVFPHIAIRTAQPAFGNIKDSLSIQNGLINALLVTYFLPSLFALTYGLAIPVKMQILPWIAVLSNVCQFIVSAFCLLWGLSILSIGYAKAATGLLPVEL